MSRRRRAGSSRSATRARLPAGLSRYMEVAAGSWTVLCRREHLDLARAFLGPLPPESLLHALRRSAGAAVSRIPRALRRAQEEGALPKASGEKSGSKAPARGGTLELACGEGRHVLVKALSRGGLPGRLGGGFHGRRRLLAEMAVLVEAERRGIPTAPLAFGAIGEMKRGGALPILATEKVEGALNLADVMASTRGGPGALPGRRRALEAAGAAVRRMHDLGLDHPDLNIGNILVVRAGTPPGKGASGAEPGGLGARGVRACVIDLGHGRPGAAPGPARRGANLVRLLRSAEKHLGTDGSRARDAAAFLRGYLRAAPDPDRRLRKSLLGAVRRRLPAVALHRLGWRVAGRRPGRGGRAR